MYTLGIESSCDETSFAILENERVISNFISSQEFHSNFGGVVPELSSRAHIQAVLPLLKNSLKKSNLRLEDIDLIAATAGPGLIGAVLVGFMFAKGLALSLNKPLVPVNHIEGHIFSGFLMDEKPEYPFLCLLVSGGHTMLLLVESDLKLKLLGSTRDDAAGEAFDKVAKMLGLGYPGGPKIASYANKCNEASIIFPVAKLKGEYDFSFSGLKTAVLRYLQKNYTNMNIPEEDKYNIAASFQNAVVKALTNNISSALEKYKVNSLALVGGVAANNKLREAVVKIGSKYKLNVVIPKNEYCGDNGAMIALRGYNLFQNQVSENLDFKAFANYSEFSFIK